jgi:hypothetical protein
MAELRKKPRMQTLKGANISFHERNSVIGCMVRSLTSDGACLEVVSQSEIPNTFELVMDSDKCFRPCRVAWRKSNRIGVQFQPPIVPAHPKMPRRQVYKCPN